MVWRQIISDCLGIELLKPKEKDACFGAALVGGIGVGLFRTAEEAVGKCVRIEQRILPQTEAQASYEGLFPIYKKTQRALEEINLRISNWSGKTGGLSSE
jgi:xylulokinase